MPLCKSRLVGSVLVVSDDPVTRTELISIMENAGHYAHVVDNTRAAFQCLNHIEFDFDAVVVAAPLLDFDEESYAQQFIERSPSVCVILLGFQCADDHSLSLHDGKMIGRLSVPFPQDILLNMIRLSVQSAALMRRKTDEQP